MSAADAVISAAEDVMSAADAVISAADAVINAAEGWYKFCVYLSLGSRLQGRPGCRSGE